MALDDALRDSHEWADAYRSRSESMLAPVRDHFAGNPCGLLLFVKGVPGEAERSGGAILSGADGEALAKSLGRLGFAEADVVRCLVELPDGRAIGARELRESIEAIDPIMVVALDARARDAVACAFEAAAPEFGVKARMRGYTIVAVDGFEEALSAQEGKRRAWAQLKQATRPGEPY